MVSEYTYCPQTDFFIERVDRDEGYDMLSFHIHHKFEIFTNLKSIMKLQAPDDIS